MKHLVLIGLACLLAGALIGIGRNPNSDPEAVRLIEMAMKAPHEQDYTARATTFADYGGKMLHTEAVIYNARGGKWRIEHRLGSMAGVIAGRNGPGMYWQYDPETRSFTTDVDRERLGSDNPNLDDALKRLSDSSRATVVKSTRIAGRPVTEISLTPKTAGRSRLLWIDNEKGVILRFEERSVDDDLISATTYRSITYDVTAPADRFLPLPPSGSPVHWVHGDDFAVKRVDDAKSIKDSLGMDLVEPRYIPRGYTREGLYITHCPGCDHRAAVSHFIDGLNSFTVVQVPERCRSHMERRPIDFGLGKVVFSRQGSDCFYVMGEIPESVLQRINSSLHE